jgi:alkyl hydroperoxide reductase subunit AhpF
MANMLDEAISKQVRELFQEIDRPVEVLYFGTDEKERCQLCSETKQLLEEVTALSDRLTLQSYDIDQDLELARQYHVDSTPTFVMAVRDGDTLVDYGVRFKGIPSGHEFATLVNALVIVSKRDSGLSAKTRGFLAGLTKPVRLEVFSTPT